MTKELHIAVLSDIHLGHRKNKTKDIVTGLRAMISDDQDAESLHLIVLAGDVFDRLLNVSEDDVEEVLLWMSWLLELCAKHDIVLRVLEGTPSHEWLQSNIFESIIKVKQIPVDFKYVTTVLVEHITSLNINVLYVPDEWSDSTDKTLTYVKAVIKQNGLEKVDYAFMHGNFNYQIPIHLKKIPRHDEQEYLKLVEHYIFIGHVHRHTSFDRIIAQGSFDRLSHGEEEPKGHVRSKVSATNRSWYFVENKLAKIYKTIECKDNDLEKTFNMIINKVKKLPPKSAVRISALAGHLIFENMNELITRYPLLSWTKLVKKTEVEELENEEQPEFNPITINRDNILSLVMDRVKMSTNDSLLISKAQALLTEVL